MWDRYIFSFLQAARDVSTALAIYTGYVVLLRANASSHFDRAKK